MVWVNMSRQMGQRSSDWSDLAETAISTSSVMASWGVRWSSYRDKSQDFSIGSIFGRKPEANSEKGRVLLFSFRLKRVELLSFFSLLSWFGVRKADAEVKIEAGKTLNSLNKATQLKGFSQQNTFVVSLTLK